jgi:hypothetical protein
MSRHRRNRPDALLETTFAGATARLHRAEGTYGTPTPRILLELPQGTSHRVTSAKAYTLAAAVELASHECRARWAVTVQAEETVAWVDLEMSEGLPDEVAAGLEMLRAVLVRGV